MSAVNGNGEQITLPARDMGVLEVIGRNWANHKRNRWRWVAMLVLAQNGMNQREIAAAFKTNQSSVARGIQGAIDALKDDPDLLAMNSR